MFHLPCYIHDDDYDIGGDAGARRKADRALFRRCITIIMRNEQNPWSMTWLFSIAMLYYISVRTFGFMYFKFVKK